MLFRGLVDLLWGTVCPVCDRDVEGGLLVHPACLARIDRAGSPPPARTRVVAAFTDGPHWFRLLHRWKYGGEFPLARVVASAMVAGAPGGLRDAILVPVPDDPLRRIQRGYSPTGDLAEELGRRLGMRVDRTLLRRRRRAPSQTGCADDAARRRNVAGVFRSGDLGRWPAHRVLVLVEDQVTSGATIGEAVPLLRARGNPVLVWCAARAARAPERVP